MVKNQSSGKSEMTSIDIHYMIRELKDVIEGAFFRKVYQWKQMDTFQFIFEIYAPKAGHLGMKSSTLRLYVDKSHTFLTDIKQDAPMTPPGFCQLLRKKLIGQKIREIKQAGINRIIEMKTDSYIIIIENFHHGNVILCDKDKKIIMPLYHQTWKDRTVRPNKKYEYPPENTNPIELEKKEFLKVAKEFDKKIVVLLSVEMSLGSVYANEIVHRCGIDSDADSNSLDDKALSGIYETMKRIIDDKISPSLYDDFVSPFKMESREDEPEKKDTFSKALDSFFTSKLITTAEKEEKRAQETAKNKIERIIKSQEDAIIEMKDKGSYSKSIGELIYNHYQFIQNVVNQLLGARDSGLSWSDIKEKLKTSETKMSKAIANIDEKKGIVSMLIEGKKFDIDYKKSMDANATMYFETSKKMKGKLESAGSALVKSTKRLDDTEKEAKESLEKVRKKEQLKRQHKSRWYERFKWFVTSDGFLVVAGKDAETNEELIKTHTSNEDFVFHTDIQGAAFAVIKAEGKEVSKIAKDEAAVLAAVSSKAWTRQLGTIDVYGITPKQVLKVSPDGINLPKGSFYIDGERLWYRNTKLEIAIGFWKNPENGKKEVISGPKKSIKSKTKYYIMVRPGSTDATDLTKGIKAEIVPKASAEDKKWIDRINAEEIRRLIPGGIGNLL